MSTPQTDILDLFYTGNFVLPQDEAEYAKLTGQLWDRLNPQDALEGAYAMEILRATWRLRRCANAESAPAAPETKQTRTPHSTPCTTEAAAPPVLHQTAAQACAA